jgi:threonine synthase
MNYFSLNSAEHQTSFKDAVIRGIAPDKGLYFPESITALDPEYFETIQDYSTVDLSYEAIRQFIGDEIPEAELKSILTEVLDFEFPVVELDKNVATLELFHGPTMAFKDVGARFMARCLGYFSKQSNNKENVTVLVATSGDTGGAVANGFLGVEGVDVVILYPKGKVSPIQEKQLTTLGQNIRALEVEGSFDDCQAFVKKAFLDESITDHIKLTSANSINVARWLPQMLYYILAYQQLKDKAEKLVFSVPSGNFGNICAGIVAYKLGLPVHHFIASTNINRVIPDYMDTKTYTPRASQATISNAMDVGDPSNFIRIQKLFSDDYDQLATLFSSESFDDDQTKAAMLKLFIENNYIADPHGAVGYLGLESYLESHPDTYGIFLETAHPVKFLEVVEETLRINVEIPKQIEKVMGGVKKSVEISTYDQLKSFLLG